MYRALLHVRTFALAALVAFPMFASADSVLWNNTIVGGIGVCEVPQGTCAQIPWQVAVGFNNPNITIQYHALVTNATTGEVIPPGASVPVGTGLRFTFKEHRSVDIYWFTTGSWADSPYGDWGSPSVAPPIACRKDDFVGDVPTPWAKSDKIFSPLIVAPPARSIAGLGSPSLQCGALQGNSVVCKAIQAGQIPAVFNFGPTTGTFYAQWIFSGGLVEDVASYASNPGVTVRPGVCGGTTIPMLIQPGVPWPSTDQSWAQFANNSTYADGVFSNPGSGTTALAVPAQVIPYPITVVDVGDDSPPTNPTVSGGACTVGSPYTISMSSTDSDGDQVKYGIDWNRDGSIDQFVPPSGYVDSGVAQTASRTYARGKDKTVKVIAMDSKGLTSGWTSFTFTCDDQTGGPRYSCVDGSCVPSATGSSLPICRASCGTGGPLYSCVDGSCVPSATGSSLPICRASCGTGGGGGGGGSASLIIHATPSLVRRGDTTEISWNATGVIVGSCTVMSPTDQAADGTGDWAGKTSSGVTTSPIQSQTVYTLRCRDLDGSTLTQSKTVNIVPIEGER
ncbi:MAG: hypothetical protein Q7R90_01760 [bacterium]|nr:hypothetical protein [bacterium]